MYSLCVVFVLASATAQLRRPYDAVSAMNNAARTDLIVPLQGRREGRRLLPVHASVSYRTLARAVCEASSRRFLASSHM